MVPKPRDTFRSSKRNKEIFLDGMWEVTWLQASVLQKFCLCSAFVQHLFITMTCQATYITLAWLQFRSIVWENAEEKDYIPVETSLSAIKNQFWPVIYIPIVWVIIGSVGKSWKESFGAIYRNKAADVSTYNLSCIGRISKWYLKTTCLMTMESGNLELCKHFVNICKHQVNNM